MPEASVHKYYRMVARQHDVGLARQVSDMKSKPKTMTVQQAANQDFRLGVATTYAGHHPAACLAVYYINHQANNDSGSGVPSRS